MNPHALKLADLVWVQVCQVTLAALAVGIVTRIYCRNKPHLAHLLWLVVLVKCLTPPIWSSPTGLFSWVATLTARSSGSPDGGDVPDLDEFARLYGAFAGRSSSRPGDEAGAPHVPAAGANTFSGREAKPGEARGAQRWPRTAVSAGLAWFGGTIVYASLMLGSTCRLWRRIVQSRVAVAPHVQELFGRLRRTIGVSDRARIVVVRETIGPLAFGLLHPAVVLPEDLVLSCTPDELEPIMAHELMHVRRRDGWVALFQVVVQSLWWCHPLIWWANRRIIDERERCCDEAVIGRLEWQPAQYARSLLAVLEWKAQSRWLAPVPGIRRFEIQRRRFEHLLKHAGRFHVVTPRRDWWLLIAGMLFLIPGAAPARTGIGQGAAPPGPAAPFRGENTLPEDYAQADPQQAPAEEIRATIAPADDQPSTVGTGNHIFAMNADGTGARRIASIPDVPIINSPEISPDGEWIAVDGWKANEDLTDAHLLLVNVATGQVRDLGIGAMPTWSADGRWIAYSKYPPNGGVYVREVNGDNHRLIDRGGWGIQWSGDGYKLAYGRGGNIVVYDLIADTWTEIFPPGREPYAQIYWNCKWSPDSKRICFKGRRKTGEIDIAIVSARGDATDLKVCCDGKDFNEDIGWHPDGKRIVIPHGAIPGDGPSQLYEFDPDRGDSPKLLAGQPTDRNNAGMCWSRDGKTLYFISQK